jgi:hypothetical protein
MFTTMNLMVRYQPPPKEEELMNQHLQHWVRIHPIESFFLLSTAICFGTISPAIYLVPHDAGLGDIVGFYLGRIGATCPVLTRISSFT